MTIFPRASVSSGMWFPNDLATRLSFSSRRSAGRIEGRVYEDAKRPSRGKTHPNRSGRQDVKMCIISAGEQEASKDAFSAGHRNHLIQNLCLDPKGAQTTKVMNTHEPNAALWAIRQ